MPRYPGDIVVGEDKGPLADMIRRHSSRPSRSGGDLSIRLAGQSGDEPVSIRVVGVRRAGRGGGAAEPEGFSSEESRLKRQVAQAIEDAGGRPARGRRRA